MFLQSSRLTTFLFLQLVLVSIHFVHGGILSNRGPTAGYATGNKPLGSVNRTGAKVPGRCSAGVCGLIPQHRRSLLGFPGDDDGLAGDEPYQHVRQPKPNHSPKDRSEMRTYVNQDDAFSPSPSPVDGTADTRRSNLSKSGPETLPPPSPAPNATVVSSPTLEEIERLARLEMLKRTFLEQLGMDRPPNVTRPMPDLPSVVLNRLLLDGKQDEQPRRLKDTHPQQIIVFADEDAPDCGPDVDEDSCFKFEISDQVDHSVVFSSHVWVYVTHAPEGTSVFVGTPQHHYGSRWRVLSSMKLYSREGWVELEIPVDKHKWNRHHHYFEISTKPLQAGGNRTVARDSNHRPMLLLAMTEDGKAGRSRRSVGQCTAGQTSCCMKDFTVDFVEIGWDSWIIWPLSFDAHYCSGECGMTSRHFLKDHAEIVAQLIERGKAEADMSLCCVANDISGLDVFYFLDEQTDVVHQRLFDVVVENCGCL